MIDRARIVAKFDEIEAARGGYHATNAREVCEAVAAELGLDYAEVREVMVDEWTVGGSG